MSARAGLRAGTAAEHDRVDRLFSRFDLRREEDYRHFLLAQAAAFLPIGDRSGADLQANQPENVNLDLTES
ncbi:MAG: hypothetical protein M3N39_00180 [Pseudomonadota bacterium]|nr:hypothetical protein [Pseudomonadota bacterium]